MLYIVSSHATNLCFVQGEFVKQIMNIVKGRVIVVGKPYLQRKISII